MKLTGHAWVAKGTADDVPRALSLLQMQGIETQHNPDLSVRTFSTFGIDDAHEMSIRATSRALKTRRVFVIVASTITTEAQNALLKTLEEPRAGAQFLVLVPTPHTLLKTILSRAQIVQLPELPVHKGTLCTVDAMTFLKSRPGARIELLKPLLEKNDDDVYDTPMILKFFSDIECVVADISDTHVRAKSLRVFYTVRKYATDRGALIKALLESLALLLPVV